VSGKKLKSIERKLEIIRIKNNLKTVFKLLNRNNVFFGIKNVLNLIFIDLKHYNILIMI